MLTFAMRCNLGVTLTELTKPKNVTVAKKIGSITDDIDTSLAKGSEKSKVDKKIVETK